jgi:hypothetical protein
MTDARELTMALGGRWHRSYGLARCPAHDDRSPSLNIRDGESSVLLTCYAMCERTAIISALKAMRLWGGDREATDPPPRRHPPAPPPEQYETLSSWGRRIWAECEPITATDPAGRYLVARGCALPPADGGLRRHPHLRHGNGHVGPAMVGLVTDVRDPDRWLNLHRTWIDPNRPGRKMFHGWPCGSEPRLLLKDHRKLSGVIRLWPDSTVTAALGIAEGIETALTLARVFRPVWSVLDANNLKAFPVLPGVESITVCVDHDDAGLKAFDALCERWTAAGREVRKVLAPRSGDDFNDWARRDA